MFEKDQAFGIFDFFVGWIVICFAEIKELLPLYVKLWVVPFKDFLLNNLPAFILISSLTVKGFYCPQYEAKIWLPQLYYKSLLGDYFYEGVNLSPRDPANVALHLYL